MAQAFAYHVTPTPDRSGWFVAAERFVAHSLPYGTKEEAMMVVEELARQHPGSTVVVDEQPAAVVPPMES